MREIRNKWCEETDSCFQVHKYKRKSSKALVVTAKAVGYLIATFPDELGLCILFETVTAVKANRRRKDCSAT